MKSANTYLVLTALITQIIQCNADFPFRNTSLPWNDRVDDLVGRLTLEELVLQIARGGGPQGPAPAIERLDIFPYQWSTECLRGDAEAGNATSFPQAIGLSAIFSRDLVFQMAEATGIEVRAKHTFYMTKKIYHSHTGLSCFSPVINIMRHPLWGRNQETYGEDPYLSGELSKSYVRGLQGDHPRYIRANAGCKHFDAYAGPENVPISRFKFDAEVSNRDWWMTFLPQFRECVKAGTYNIMCSYNSVNGIPACVNKNLLTHILRGELGFNGYVVSDQLALEFVSSQHHYTKSYEETGILGVKAGCNLDLTNYKNNVYTTTLKSVQMGNLTKDEILNLAKPLFYTRMRHGEFDPPDMNPYTKLDMSNIQSEAHRQLSLELAIKSFVLLKNAGNLLPMKGGLGKIAFVGPFADSYKELFGDYSPDPNLKFTKTPREGLQMLASTNSFANGCDNSTKCTKYNDTEVSLAIDGADMAIVCLGTGIAVEKEQNDRHDLNLPGYQLQLLKDVVSAMEANKKPVILLLFNAGPLDVSWAVSSSGVQVLMECFFPAQATGDALYQVFTNTNGAIPGGRLPATWPSSMSQVLPITNYTMKGRTYRYFEGDPLFPFGYGMSYTEFDYHDLVVSPSVIKPCDNVTVSVVVSNIGKLAGDEVTQVYISWSNPSVPVPVHQLVEFNRTHLKPGEKVHLQFQIVPRVMAVYTDQEVIEAGEIFVFVGGQQPKQKVKLSSPVLDSSFVVMGEVTSLKSCKYPGWGN